MAEATGATRAELAALAALTQNRGELDAATLNRILGLLAAGAKTARL